MPDLNKYFFMGRLTADPELRNLPGGKVVTELRCCTNRQWKGQDGEVHKDTLFIDATVWGKSAENCCQYLRKGSSVHIEGSLKQDVWEDKATGERRSKIKITADWVQFLDGRQDRVEGRAEEAAAPRRGQTTEGPAPTPDPMARRGRDVPEDPEQDQDAPF